MDMRQDLDRKLRHRQPRDIALAALTAITRPIVNQLDRWDTEAADAINPKDDQ